MAVSVVTLKTGDRVITELKEIFDGEGEDKRGVCLLMEDPYVLNLDGGTPQYLTEEHGICLLYTSPSPRDLSTSRMPSSA